MPSLVSSSLTYEILLYLNSFYFYMFAVCEICMGIIKALTLPSPGLSTILMEHGLLLFLIATEAGRIYLGRKGNLTEKAFPFFFGIILMVPSALATIYFLFWQNYVLRLEVILCSIQLILLSSELIISVMCFIAMCRSPNPDE